MYINKFSTIFLFLLFINYSKAQEANLMSYNIRLDIAADGNNAWEYRKASIVQRIKDLSPHIIGTQEGLPNQINFIDKQLINYSFIGIGRDGGENRSEHCAIFFDKTEFEVIESNTFWLSKTPEVVSKDWDAAYIRICTYGHLKYRGNGKSFWIFNTHLDNHSRKARKKGLQLICKKIETINPGKLPVILMGDFNAEPDSKLIKKLSMKFIDAKIADIDFAYDSSGTFNGFKFGEVAGRRIDYIFLDKKNFKIVKYKIPKNLINGRYASDHFPVFAKIEFL